MGYFEKVMTKQMGLCFVSSNAHFSIKQANGSRPTSNSMTWKHVKNARPSEEEISGGGPSSCVLTGLPRSPENSDA